MHVANLADLEPFTTPAGSTIRELTNTGERPMKLLCCCAPAYSHDDTVLTEG